MPKIKDFYISVRCSATIVSTCTIFCSFINIRVQYMAFYIFTPFDFENKNMHHSSGQHLIICYFIFIRKNITTTCITIVNGTPTVKQSFLVLCLNKYIAINAPNEPPMNDNPSSVTILILDFLSIAAILSTANAANVTKLITKTSHT